MKEIEELLSILTVEQKARLLSGDGSWHTARITDIPQIMMTDGPHGLRKQKEEDVADINKSYVATCFPTACATASSWNPDLLTEMSKCIGQEALHENVSIVLGPGVNIKRNPLCGRNFEYFSEDPFLAGRMASAWIDGVQSKGVGTSLKHFAVNSQETRRMSIDMQVDERVLREIYLPAFEYAVKKSEPTTIMAAYNKVNGSYCTENFHLLQEILRDEWGFRGAVVSDWGATNHVVECVKNGLNLEMPDSNGRHTSQIVEAVASGALSIEQLNSAVVKVLELIQNQSDKVEPNANCDYSSHHYVAKKVETDCAVLLKNEDNILPLQLDKKYLVVGAMAQKMRYQSTGSSHINTAQTPSILDVFQLNNISYEYAQGYDEDADNINVKLEAEAVSKAQSADYVLFFGGLTDAFEGEFADRKTMDMPTNQVQLLNRLHAVNENIVFVFFAGSPVAMPWISSVKALLDMYLGGQAVGESCYDLLFGKDNPSGKLAETFPVHYEDTPSFNYFANRLRAISMRESIFVGYRYYDTFNIPTLFDFGFGLSYTTFAYSNLDISGKGTSLKVSCDVTNTGTRVGKEIVELYIVNPLSDIMRAKRELKGFVKVELQPNETKKVDFVLDDRSFSIFDTEENKFVVVDGEYGIQLSASLNDVRLETKVSVKGKLYTRNDRLTYPSYFAPINGSFVVTDEEFVSLSGQKIINDTKINKGDFTIHDSLGDVMQVSRFTRFVVNKIASMGLKKSSKSEVEQTLSYSMETPLDSLITMSNGILTENMAYGVVDIGNGRFFSGLRKILSKNKTNNR